MAGSLSKECRFQTEVLIAKLRRRQVVGSFDVSISTTKLLRNIVASSRSKTVHDLLMLVKEVGSRIEAAQPIELSVGNMVRRVLHIISEEACLHAKDNSDKIQSESESDFRSSVGSKTPYNHIMSSTSQYNNSVSNSTTINTTNIDTPSSPGSGSTPGTPTFPPLLLNPLQTYTQSLSSSVFSFGQNPGNSNNNNPRNQLRRSIHEFGSTSSNNSSDFPRSASQNQFNQEFSLSPVHADDMKDDSSLAGSVSGASAMSNQHAISTDASFYQSIAVTRTLLADIKQSIEEMTDEFETTLLNISNQAWEHIHSKEIILTIGYSRTVAQFLKIAAQVREFNVIIAETAPSYEGQKMAKDLAESGIDSTLITDSAIFAMMSRVNKVILGTHAVAANGGMVSISGTSLITAAAKHYSVPVVVCSGLYKMSPKYPHDTGIFNLCVQPDPISPFLDTTQDGDLSDMYDNVEIINPYFDYSSPDDISLYITNVGTHPPSFIQRLIYDTYGMADVI